MLERFAKKRSTEERILTRIDREGIVQFTQRLIQFQTINPPADYSQIAPYLQETLSLLGMETHILEGSPGKKTSLAFGEGLRRKRFFS